ncbi:MAG: DNA-3-methyladenine glycosylase family protein [Candidatus Acidiferrales bacterium]
MTEESLYPFDHKAAIAHLCGVDRRLARLIEKTEFALNLRDTETPYESLLQAIAYQSIAGKAAKVIFERIRALGSNGCCPTPQEILRVNFRVLRKAGLSKAKIAAVRDLAAKTIEGIVPTMDDALKMSDQELVDQLVSVRGIGAWTVEMFLIFRLGRPDVLPIHDYGVQKGFALTYGKKAIPKPRELAAFGERWRPYRTVASWYMWRAVDHAGKSARKITKTKGSKMKATIVVKKPSSKKKVGIVVKKLSAKKSR